MFPLQNFHDCSTWILPRHGALLVMIAERTGALGACAACARPCTGGATLLTLPLLPEAGRRGCDDVNAALVLASSDSAARVSG
jgi:hypothetical protein